VQFPVGDPNQDLADCPVNLSGGWFWVPILLFSDRCLKKVGGFDPDFPIGGYDDVDLQLRLSALPTLLLYLMPVFSTLRLNSLKKEITEIPQDMMAWAYHVNKKIDKLLVIRSHSVPQFL